MSNNILKTTANLEEWPVPEPLRAPLPASAPYPVEALGDIMGNATTALQETVKAPLALCAQSVLAAASFAVQAHCDIELPWGEIKPLSLAMLTVGESGERKSGIDNLVLKAAKIQEQSDMEEYVAALANYEMELAIWKQATDTARREKTKKTTATPAEIQKDMERFGGKPTQPVSPLRFVTDPTVEGLYKLLTISQPSIALFSDEAGLLIGGHALNSENALKTMARWCKLWDGAPFDRVRSGDGAGILYGRRMALHQLAQPEVMTTLLSDRTANGQGFLARCLVAWPESTIGSRFINTYEWAENRQEVQHLFTTLKQLMETKPRTNKTAQELKPLPLSLSFEAKELAVAASNEFEKLMASGHELAELRDRGSKAMENACRIAGILSVIEEGLVVREIEPGHLQRALVLVQWYLSEALRIRSVTTIPQAVIDAEMLLEWISDRGFKLFRSALILQKGPNPLRNKPRLMAAVEELIKNGYLMKNEPGTLVDNVKAKLSWRVNPNVF